MDVALRVPRTFADYRVWNGSVGSGRQASLPQAAKDEPLAVEAGQRLANLVCGIPRLENGEIDARKAVRAVNDLGDDGHPLACLEELERLTADQLAIDGIPASELLHESGAEGVREKVRQKFPALASAADGADFASER